MSRLKGVTIVGLASFAGLFAAGPAQAATTVGQLPGPATTNCFGAGMNLQTGVASGTSYTIPAAGVITSWQFYTGSSAASDLKLKVGRPSGGGATIVGDGAAGSQTLNSPGTFPARIPVQAGDLIGIYSSGSGSPCTIYTADSSDTVITASGDAPPNTFAPFNSTNQVKFPVQAKLEPDADHDGYGDETQDKCVGTVGTTNGCPNTLTAASAAQVGKSPRITVTATVPGAGTLKAGDASDASVASASALKLAPLTQNLTSTTSQQVPLTLSLTKQAKKKLKKKGKLKVQVKVLYAPPGGSAGAPQVLKVKLKGKKKKK